MIGLDPKTVSSVGVRDKIAMGRKGVKIEILTHSFCGPYVAQMESKGMTAATKALEAGFGKAPVFIREGGTLPILPLFKKALGADSLMMGFCAPDCNARRRSTSSAWLPPRIAISPA